MAKTKQPSEELLSQDHLLEQDDQEGSGEFRKLLEEFTSNRKFEEGEIVTGTVLRISGESVIVDVGFKSEGIVPVVEFLDRTAIEIGKKVDLLLEQVEDQDGQIVLSKIKADFIKVWDKVQKSLDSEVVVDGKVLRKVKGGLIIDLMGVDAFLPGSQIGLRPLETIDSLLGQSIPLKIIKINKKKRNIVVSRRVVLDADRDKQRAVILAEIDKGQVREG
ncbi:MAG: S1 RNA-binding domain-containing protein, partial [bacterium]|nr:S1 RNA-binding domain-containing protein [bacterium]